ncbi:hypothetical protein [Winogradskyella schleiferi]|uniref:hypothetical protein n=1 Tax=Winogradskyella schleiferi TaxID=2686078 RepID=UPI0015BFAEE4|nr:hypothetical protein [Winogradskyella schleiferi]
MKKTYIFLSLCCATYLNANAQSDCSTAYAHIVYALSHSESALEANNVTHAKHFAKRAKEAFIKVQKSISDCECDTVDDTVYDAINYLSKAKNSTTLEDAYYYAHKGKKLANATIAQLDDCTIAAETPIVEAIVMETLDATDEQASLDASQNQLLQRQQELERQQAELQVKIAEKQNEELLLQKEHLIAKLESLVTQNVDTFNNALEACDCSTETLKATVEKEQLKAKSIHEIKGSVIGLIKSLTSNYMKQLADCDREDDND